MHATHNPTHEPRHAVWLAKAALVMGFVELALVVVAVSPQSIGETAGMKVEAYGLDVAAVLACAMTTAAALAWLLRAGIGLSQHASVEGTEAVARARWALLPPAVAHAGVVVVITIQLAQRLNAT